MLCTSDAMSDGGTHHVTQQNIFVMTGLWHPQVGLLARDPAYGRVGIVIPSCRAIHTFFMQEPIDVVFIARGRVVHVSQALKSYRVSINLQADCVMEWASNRRECVLPETDHQVIFKKIDKPSKQV